MNVAMATPGPQYSNRGKGKCPDCGEAYTNRYKPKYCKCGFLLGGTFTPKHTKVPKLDIPACTEVVRGPWSVYSCKTSTHDDRCLVIEDRRHGSLIVSCEHQACKQNRAVMVNSNSSDHFTCSHVASIQNAASAPSSTHFNIPGLHEYKCSDSVRENLASVQSRSSSCNLPLAVAVSPTMFCVFGQVTANTPSGYCHVQVKKDNVRCCSRDCKTFFAKAKQHKAKNICMHVHILLSLGIVNSNNSSEAAPANVSNPSSSFENAQPSSSSVVGSSLESVPTSSVADGDPASTSDSVSRTSSIALNMKRSLPLHIPAAIIMQSHCMDVKGWPSSMAPTDSNCGLCSSPLSKERSHPGQRGEAFLLTNLNPFKPITLFVKFCENRSCQAMHQVFPYGIGQ